MLITKILMALPANFNHFHSAWESTPANDRTIKNLTSRLMVEEARMAATDEELDTSAFSAKTYSRPKPRSQSKLENAKPGKCFQCNKTGWRRDCPMLRKTSGAYSNYADDDGDALVCDAFISEEEFYNGVRESEKWFMDSGASDHMSNRREWFSNLMELKVPIPIRIGNGKHIFAIGTGDILISAFDGKCWVRKRLTKVLFVPDIKLQLFSFGTALDKGLTFTANHRKCFFKKNDVTVAVGEKGAADCLK